MRCCCDPRAIFNRAQHPIVPVLPYAAAPKRQWAALAAFSALMPLLPLGRHRPEGRGRRSVLFGVKQLKLQCMYGRPLFQKVL